MEISSFYKSVPKLMIICYTVSEIWRVADIVFIFHFGVFFALLPLNDPKIQDFIKMKKTPRDIVVLNMCTNIYDHIIYSSWDVVQDGRTDRQTGGQSDIQRWVPHLTKAGCKVRNLILETIFKLHNLHKRRGVLKTLSNIQDADFCKNSQGLLVVNYVLHKTPSQKFYRVPNAYYKVVVKKLTNIS